MSWTRFIDLQGVIWSLPLVGCTQRQGRVRYLIVISQESLSWVIQSSAHFWHLDVLMLLLLRDAFWYVGWIQLWIWVIGITHLMTDYLMLFDFRLIPHLIPYWGIFSFFLRFIDLHGATWSLPLAGCTPRRERVRYFIMVPRWSLLWAIQSNLYFFDICMSSCSLFLETFPWCLGSIRITEIAHLTVDGFMSLDFRLTIHLMPYWGIFPFRLRFTDFHGVACPSPLMRYRLRWWPSSRVSLELSN